MAKDSLTAQQRAFQEKVNALTTPKLEDKPIAKEKEKEKVDEKIKETRTAWKVRKGFHVFGNKKLGIASGGEGTILLKPPIGEMQKIEEIQLTLQEFERLESKVVRTANINSPADYTDAVKQLDTRELTLSTWEKKLMSKEQRLKAFEAELNKRASVIIEKETVLVKKED